jgi:hypothetical protein
MTAEGLPGAPLRIAVLGDFDGPHTRRWLRVFVERGHDVHAIAYYQPRNELPSVKLHVLRGTPAAASGQVQGGTVSCYMRAGLKRTLREIEPDVFHAHYAVEHGFYGAFAGFHPYVVSCWGSDIHVESHKPAGRLIARYALGRADLVTANDPAMARRVVELGVPRALEPLYNVDVIIRAFAQLHSRLPTAQLLIAHDGSERPRLEAMAQALGLADAVHFLGRLTAEELRDRLAASQVYVSVPSFDSLALSTMEAMAGGAFPVVSDLPSQEGWIEHGVNGLRVPAGNVEALAEALYQALTDAELRRRARALNRDKVEAEGQLEQNMLVMERYYYRLAGRPVAAEEAI